MRGGRADRRTREAPHSEVSRSPVPSAQQDQAFDHTGANLTKEQVFQRLKPGMAVLLLPSGQNLQPAYKPLLSKDAVALTISSP